MKHLLLTASKIKITRRSTAAAILLLIIGVPGLWWAFTRGVRRSAFQLVPIRYIANNDINGGFAEPGMFWVSNCTAQPIAVGLVSIETHTPSGWTNSYTPRYRISLQFSESLLTPASILPSLAAEESQPLPFELPTNGIWRARFVLFKQCSALENAAYKISTRVPLPPAAYWLLFHRNNLMPLSRSTPGAALTFYKPVCEITSDPVPAALPLAARPRQVEIEPRRARPSPDAIARARAAMRLKVQTMDKTPATSDAPE
jgi:hypothetical protein